MSLRVYFNLTRLIEKEDVDIDSINKILVNIYEKNFIYSDIISSIDDEILRALDLSDDHEEYVKMHSELFKIINHKNYGQYITADQLIEDFVASENLAFFIENTEYLFFTYLLRDITPPLSVLREEVIEERLLHYPNEKNTSFFQYAIYWSTYNCDNWSVKDDNIDLFYKDICLTYNGDIIFENEADIIQYGKWTFNDLIKEVGLLHIWLFYAGSWNNDELMYQLEILGEKIIELDDKNVVWFGTLFHYYDLTSQCGKMDNIYDRFEKSFIWDTSYKNLLVWEFQNCSLNEK